MTLSAKRARREPSARASHRLRGSVTALCAALAIVGCSSRGGPDANSTNRADGNAASSWAVSLDNPTGTCFRPDANVDIVVSATNAAGAPIDSPSFIVAADPSDGLESDGAGGFLTRGEGPLELTVRYTGLRSGQSTITPQTFALMRDGTRPVVSVTAPVRGAMRQTATNDEPVGIVGNVTDALSPLKVVIVNEEVLPIGGDSLFESLDGSQPADWGINVLRVRAADECGNSVDHSQSFLQSADYLAPVVSQSLAARVPNASVIRVAQAAFDDSNRNDFDDFATAAERYLQNNLTADINGVVASVPTLNSGRILGCEYSANPLASISMAVGSPTLSTRLQTGSFDVTTVVNDLRIPITYRQVCFGLLGNVLTDISATFSHRIDILTTVVSVTPQVSNRNLVVTSSTNSTVTGFSVDSSTNPTLADAINLALPLFSASIQGAIEDAIDGVLTDFADALAASMLEPLTEVFPIEFPPPIDLSLEVAGDYTSINVTTAAVDMELGQYIYSPVVATPHATGLGAIFGGFATRSLASLPGPFAYGLNDDGMNQMLWSVWHGGGLELNDLQSYTSLLSDVDVDLAGLTIDASGLLPPVIEAASLDDQLSLGIGDVRMTGTIDLNANASLDGSGVVSFDVFAGIVTDGRSGFDIAGNALSLRLGDPSSQFYLYVETLELDGVALSREFSQDVRAYLRDVIEPLLRELASDIGTQLQLPQFRLDFPAQTFGPDSGFILDIVLLKRDLDRFIASIDPDDAFAPPVAVVDDWDALADAAIAAARSEAAGWLGGVEVGCFINRTIAGGWAVRTNAFDVTDGVKQALSDAGAPEPLAREWNRIFKSAWLGWGDLLRIPSLPWFPTFAGDFPVGVPQQSPATTGPIGTLTSVGEAAMSRAALLAELEFWLQDYLDQIGANEALDRFATDIGGRFDTLLANGTIDDVEGIAVYPDLALYVIGLGVTAYFLGPTDAIGFVLDFWPPPPPTGRVVGACQRDGRFGQTAF